jgi:hypothetical protein
MSLTCATTGVKVADGSDDDIVLVSSRCKLMSIHVTVTSSNSSAALSTLKFYDNASAASGTEISRLNLLASSTSPQTIEFDMHGVLCANGLFVDVTVGSNCTVAYSVEFA